MKQSQKILLTLSVFQGLLSSTIAASELTQVCKVDLASNASNTCSSCSNDSDDTESVSSVFDSEDYEGSSSNSTASSIETVGISIYDDGKSSVRDVSKENKLRSITPIVIKYRRDDLTNLLIDTILGPQVSSEEREYYKSLTNLDMIPRVVNVFFSNTKKNQLNAETTNLFNHCRAQLQELFDLNMISEDEAIIGFAVLPDSSIEELIPATKIFTRLNTHFKLLIWMFWNYGKYRASSLQDVILAANEIMALGKGQDNKVRFSCAKNASMLILECLNSRFTGLTIDEIDAANEAVLTFAYNSPDYIHVVCYIMEYFPQYKDLAQQIIHSCINKSDLSLEDLKRARNLIGIIDPMNQNLIHKVSKRIGSLKRSNPVVE